MSKEAYYFSHDANARNDPKILAMRSEYGIQGYGIYWTIVEMLREQEEYKLPVKEYIFNAIAMQVQCKDYAKDDAKRFVESCINDYELFESDDAFFWSNSLLKRMDKRSSISEKRSKAAQARWSKASDTNNSQKTDDANAMQVYANAMQTDARKGKEMKGKEIKEVINTLVVAPEKPIKPKKEKEIKIQYAEFVTLTEKEFNKLVESHGSDGAGKIITILDNYKGANGKKYASDYRAILNWVEKRYQEDSQKPQTKQDAFNLLREGLNNGQGANLINHPINNNVLPKYED